MKIERLIGILGILLQQEKVTAPMLAEKFEVSRRTISRDIEAICQAGIPLVTTQGAGGGISIMEGYRLDRTLLTSADMQAILAGLRSLDSISGTRRYQQLMEKLSVKSSKILSVDQHILIDLSSWHKSEITDKIERILTAISRCETIRFVYVSPKGDGQRQIEPYRLVFQWSSWYVWGFCLKRKEFRLFKLIRMIELELTGRLFEPMKPPLPEIPPVHIFPANIMVKARFEPEIKWRLMDEYGLEHFQEQEDGKLLFSFGFTDKETLFGWLASFGEKAELIEPRELRREFYERLERIQEKYNGDSSDRERKQ